MRLFSQKSHHSSLLETTLLTSSNVGVCLCSLLFSRWTICTFACFFHSSCTEGIANSQCFSIHHIPWIILQFLLPVVYLTAASIASSSCVCPSAPILCRSNFLMYASIMSFSSSHSHFGIGQFSQANHRNLEHPWLSVLLAPQFLTFQRYWSKMPGRM